MQAAQIAECDRAIKDLTGKNQLSGKRNGALSVNHTRRIWGKDGEGIRRNSELAMFPVNFIG